MSRRWTVPVLVVVVAGLLLAGLPVKDRLRTERREGGLKKVDLTELPPLGAASLLLMGGFRGIAVDILWLRVINLHQQRQYEEEISLIELISRLQPYYISVWVFQAWNITYNISVQYPDLAEQWVRIKYGIGFLKKGLGLNPGNGDLLFHLGVMHRDKVHQNPYYEDKMETDPDPELKLVVDNQVIINNFEKAAYYFRRASEVGGVSTFAPRVVDSGAIHSYMGRVLQIFRRARLAPDDLFPPETWKEADPFIEMCRQECDRLNREWPKDAAFPLFPARIDFLLCDGYLNQAGQILQKGGCDDASIARARKVLDRALAEVADYRPKYENTYCEQVVRNRESEVFTALPAAMEGRARELSTQPFAGSAEWRLAVRLLGMAEAEYRRVREGLGLSADELELAESRRERAQIEFRIQAIKGMLAENAGRMSKDQIRLAEDELKDLENRLGPVKVRFDRAMSRFKRPPAKVDHYLELGALLVRAAEWRKAIETQIAEEERPKPPR